LFSPIFCRIILAFILLINFLCHLIPSKRLSASLAMDDSKAGPIKEMPLGLDATMEEEYASQSKLLQEFTSISNIDKAWIFKSDGGMASHVYRFFVLQCLVLLSSKPTQPTGVAGNNFLRLKLLLQE